MGSTPIGAHECAGARDLGGARLETIDHAILIGAVVMTLGILLGVFSARFGVPFLLVFMGVGMAAGVDGPGGIRLSNT